MKFVLSTQELNFLINKVQNIVPLKPTIPILSNFLIEAFNNEIILTATDLTVGIRCDTEAKIIEEGATTIPAKKFAQLLRELTSNNVEISSNSNEITTIIAGTSRFKLNGMGRNEFPALPDMAEANSFVIKQSDLKDMFYRTSFAVSREENRYTLTGVSMQIQNGIATFIGTDGKRLARTFCPIEASENFTCHAIIPLKAVEEIVKNLQDEGTIKIFMLNDKIALEGNNTRILTKLVTGDYPDVNRVIPDKSDFIISLHREELTSLLRQMSLFTHNNATHSVRFCFSEGELKISTNTMDIGEGHVTMPLNYTGQRFEIAFNPGFFIDILRHCKNETVLMGLTDAYNPGILTDSDNIDKPLETVSLFVIMPMRLSED